MPKFAAAVAPSAAAMVVLPTPPEPVEMMISFEAHSCSSEPEVLSCEVPAAAVTRSPVLRRERPLAARWRAHHASG
ncbi:unannotated protein [freshwater metagenome]|uniref:Unannotated protein n=1 Tax=freshwater metagenome TaxID=449393 RepID=A0A6J7GWH2_9ZZZZ